MLSELPKVAKKDFDAYIDSIKEDWATWSRLQATTTTKQPSILDELEDDDDADATDEEAVKRRKAIAQALEGSNFARKGSKGNELPPLDGIPEIFFQESFALHNPRTFDVVTGGLATSTSTTTEINSYSSGTRKSREESQQSLADFATDQILQEKLGYYLDIAEVHLNVEISLRSSSFFSALSNLQDLNSQSAEALHQINALKTMLAEVDETVAQKGLQCIQQGTRRRRLRELDTAVERVKEVVNAVQQAEDLGEAGEMEGALDIVEALEFEWEASLHAKSIHEAESNGEDSHPENGSTAIPRSSAKGDSNSRIRDDEAAVVTLRAPRTPQTALFAKSAKDRHAPIRIARIHALQSLPSRLADLRSNIARALETDLLAVLVHELREAMVKHDAHPEEWKNASHATGSMPDVVTSSLTSKIQAAIGGLVRCGKPALDSVIAAWKESMLQEVKRTLREVRIMSISPLLSWLSLTLIHNGYSTYRKIYRVFSPKKTKVTIRRVREVPSMADVPPLTAGELHR